jgi:cbb3-type cytochrome oxidase subunit 3
MGGYTTNIVISYQSLCSAAIMFKPFVILMSFIAGIFIITNTGRRAETGD